MTERKMFSTRIDVSILKELKHLSVDVDRSIADLIEEAIKELLKKYEKKMKQ